MAIIPKIFFMRLYSITEQREISVPVSQRYSARKLSAATSVILCSLLGFNPLARAQIPSWGVDEFHAPADPRWAQTTRDDVRAAYKLHLDNHPGGSQQLHDLAFQERLKNAHSLALGRARTVVSYQGYAAVLAGFAAGMGDKHIWSRPTFLVNLPRWAGIIVSKRGNSWLVSDTDESRAALRGAALISCDGENIEDLARKNLGGFRVDWNVGAQQVQGAPWLLVDEGNPFVTPPAACLFEQNGQRQTVKLSWMRIKRDNLMPRLQTAMGAGAAGYGVRRVAGGYWIALQSLMSNHAADVVKAVEDEKTALRDAPFVVLDLRGNGGGSSFFGRRIAVALLGSAAVDARLDPAGRSGCGAEAAWRVSEGNINNLDFLLHSGEVYTAPEAKKIAEAQLREMRSARMHGRAFSSEINCPDEPERPSPEAQPPSLLKARLLLLTDSMCFSSCLSVTDDFLTLGAFHIGQTTDAATHFLEVREEYLPSGYSMFSTLQAVDPGSPYQIGPFEPALIYNGDIADTRALEAWVIATAVPASQK
jgi:hypothetical protein